MILDTKNSRIFFTIAKLPLDWFMIVVAAVVTYLLRTRILNVFRPAVFTFDLPLVDYITIVFFVSFLFIAAFAVSGLYSFKSRFGMAEEFLKIVVASSAGIMVLIFYIFLRQELFNSRFLVMGSWFVAIIFVFLGRLAMRSIQKFVIARYDFGIRRIVIIGNDSDADKLMAELKRDAALGWRMVAHLDTPDIEALRKLQSDAEVDNIILASTHYTPQEIVDLVDFCYEHHIGFKYIPNIHQTLTANFDIDVVAGIPLIELRRTALGGWGKVIKRAFDFVFALISLIILSPFFLIFALIIAIDSRGPVFVRLRRVSQNKEFNLYKFRSMIAVDPDGTADSLKNSLIEQNERRDGPLFKMRNDPRITRVGHWIRKFRIDELPQLWNVLKGEMSLVGPRPHQPDEIAQYQKHHRKLLAIKAGATGLAQVSGSSDLPFEQEVALDSYYIENWSLWMDLKIALRTAFKMLYDHSAV